ncbi:methyltransferase [Campylobacter sp. CCS1377]|uniref:Methyltransferase n=1 Tax=Campylobacter sp. CCS1377 TaxID=3158229 RepID=A0AAU7EA50_9BACT
MRFKQLKNGYRYNSDSMILLDFASKQKPKMEVLDVGCGCGIVGIGLKKKYPNINLDLLDIQECNITLCEENLKLNSINAKIFLCDFKDFDTEKKYDFIVSNPPFYRYGAQKGENTHQNISKFADNLKLEDFIARANSLLKPRGKLCFCYESLAIEEIACLLKKYKIKLTALQFIHTRKDQKARLLMILAQKSSKNFCEILEPFIVYEDNVFSQQMLQVYNEFKVESDDL